jgi:hypothetical protein
MSPEMTNIVGGLIVAAFASLLTFMLTMSVRKRKVVQFNVFSMPLLRFIPRKERTLAVSVDKALLTGKADDKGQLAPIISAYGFEIEIQNVGNEDITDASIEIRLDESAKIIEYETNPAPQKNYEVSLERHGTSPNVVQVLVPYINRGQRLLVRLISTENISRECHVDIRGLGIQIRYFPGVWRALRIAVALVPIGMFLAVFKMFPGFFESLGVRTEMRTYVSAEPRIPMWLAFFMASLILIPILFAIFVDLRNRPRRRGDTESAQDWDIDVP